MLRSPTVATTVPPVFPLVPLATAVPSSTGRVDMPCRVTFDAFTGNVWQGTITKIYPQGSQAQGNSGTRFQVDIELDLEPTQEGGDGMPGGLAAMQRPSGGGGGHGGGMRMGGGGRPGGAAAAQPADAADQEGEEAVKMSQPELRPNMTANVEFVLEDHPQVLILQARMVQYDDDRKPYVEVLPDPENQDDRERHDIELGFSDGMRYEVVSGLEDGVTVIVEREIVED